MHAGDSKKAFLWVSSGMPFCCLGKGGKHNSYFRYLAFLPSLLNQSSTMLGYSFRVMNPYSRLKDVVQNATIAA